MKLAGVCSGNAEVMRKLYEKYGVPMTVLCYAGISCKKVHRTRDSNKKRKGGNGKYRSGNMIKWCTLSAFADEYSREPAEQVQMLRDNGITHIEPRFVGDKNIAEMSAHEVREFKKLLDEYGIRTASIGSPLGKIKLSDDFEGHLELSRRVFEAACLLGTSNVRVFSFYAPDGKDISDFREEVLCKLERMSDLAERMGVTLCHENEGAIYGESPESCLELVNALDGKLRCVFDMGNFVLGGYDPIKAYNMLADHVEYFHIKDALPVGAIVPPGCGEAKIAEILEMHSEKVKCEFFATLEPHLDTFDGLGRLTKRKFDNPYVFENKKTAFLYAADKMKEILG